MIKTEFFNDFVDYYIKAKHLQEKNLGTSIINNVNDPLMDNITIYDTVNRRHAGFSKILEDIHGKRVRKDLQKLMNCTEMFSSHEFHFFHLLHRFTGSGASFQPTFLPDGTRNPKEHGYHNSIIPKLIQCMAMDGIEGVKYAIVKNTEPMVTSTGNQPPSLKNGDPTKYRLAQQYYFDNFAEDFTKDYLTFLMNNEYKNNKPTGIKEAVDFSCAWHKQRGFKQWHFVLTAFVMDTAEYYPELVDPTSHCYYGANCVRAFDLIFVKEKGDPKSKADFQEVCMTELCKAVSGNPYDVEDVCCDYIRYLAEYVPKGYEHLAPEQTENNSTLKVYDDVGIKSYPNHVKDRINQVLG
jgi:hypothetical protein